LWRSRSRRSATLCQLIRQNHARNIGRRPIGHRVRRDHLLRPAARTMNKPQLRPDFENTAEHNRRMLPSHRKSESAAAGRPWYRERWPWLMMLMPGLAVLYKTACASSLNTALPNLRRRSDASPACASIDQLKPGGTLLTRALPASSARCQFPNRVRPKLYPLSRSSARRSSFVGRPRRMLCAGSGKSLRRSRARSSARSFAATESARSR
jgi:hypothetical protein